MYVYATSIKGASQKVNNREISAHAMTSHFVYRQGSGHAFHYNFICGHSDAPLILMRILFAFASTKRTHLVNIHIFALLLLGWPRPRRQLKSRKAEYPDDAKFNVQDFVKEHTQRTTCPSCNL